MSQSQFSLSWDSFKSNICSGFSTLQQNGEFVDMTLAADGHLVKAHQVLVALASPYLKDMIASAPCPHPVIYLNNISHRVLCYLLEYIYTGEVILPSNLLSSFGEAAKSLHIRGLENINGTNEYTDIPRPVATPRSMPTVDTSATFTHSFKRKVQETYEQQVALPSGARKIFIKAEGPIEVKHMESTDNTNDYTTALMDDTANDSDEGYSRNEEPNSTIDMEKLKGLVSKGKSRPIGTRFSLVSYTLYANKTIASFAIRKIAENFEAVQHIVSNSQFTASLENLFLVLLTATASNLLFTVSIRGSLQVILNRYIYNLNSTTSRTGLRRWRCVDYRNNKCSAFIVTKGNVVVNRANVHSHPFHDKKILTKLEKKSVFSALDEVEAYKEKEKETDQAAQITSDQITNEDILEEYRIDKSN